ncbi:DUF1707 domain-containing protein [Streptomyces sp. NPDC048564]|uniref:DUF1707 SHOCT-like domain-containing protein n=1 Tax=unclassified Streptomyces TaxID=2593676 RepID=UPI0033CDA438
MAAELSHTGLRASDADRDRAVDVLNAAAGGGRPAIEELDERVTAALSARTVGELAELTVDLPATPGGVEVKDVVRIEQRGGSAVRGRKLGGGPAAGDRVVLGRCDLDFTQAVTADGALRIDLDMCGGTLRLVTRPGVVVDTDSPAIDHARSGRVRPVRQVRRSSCGSRSPGGCSTAE